LPTFPTQAPNQIADDAFINSVTAAVDLLRADPTTWTPVWHSATGDPGGVTATGLYVVRGRLCTFHAEFTLGAFTIGTGPYTFDVPVTSATGFTQNVQAIAVDSSAAAFYVGSGRIPSASALINRMYFAQGTVTTVAPATPFTWANGDQLVVDGQYFTA
jgi:hypothetical protein